MTEYKYIEQVLAEDKASPGYSIDGLRRWPVDRLIVHHSATQSLWTMTPMEAIDTISAYHKEKFYRVLDENGNWHGAYYDPHHDHRLKPGPVYCAYHVLMWPVSATAWAFVPTMRGVMANVAGGCSRYVDNANAVQVCVYGDFTAAPPDELFCEYFADFFGGLGRYVRENFGRPLQVYGHKDFDDTGCPGQIYGLLGRLNEMIL